MGSETIPLLDQTDLERVRAPLAQAWTLPPVAYTSSEVFTAEKMEIFAREWLCVAREDQLPEVGDYVCIDLFDQPIVVVRGRDSELRALSRVWLCLA